MGAEAAVHILHRREIAGAGPGHPMVRAMADDYHARHVSAESALADGVIDAVIAPAETRGRLLAALTRA
jgi:acetyl-CoA carboxylase carboxyltransferase component